MVAGTIAFEYMLGVYIVNSIVHFLSLSVFRCLIWEILQFTMSEFRLGSHSRRTRSYILKLKLSA